MSLLQFLMSMYHFPVHVNITEASNRSLSDKEPGAGGTWQMNSKEDEFNWSSFSRVCSGKGSKSHRMQQCSISV